MNVLPPFLLEQGLDGLEGLAADQDGVSVSTGVSLVSEGQGYLELCPRRTVRAVLYALGVQDVRYFPLKFPLQAEGKYPADYRRLLGLGNQLPVLDLIAIL